MGDSAQDVLGRYRGAMIAMDADALAELYATDAVHELPFLFPGMPDRLVGREAIRAAYRAAWSHSDARPDQVRDVATHEVDGGTTLVVEQEVEGRLASTGERFRFAGVVVMSVRDGRIVHVRDYMDGLAVAHASGRLDAVAAALRDS